ncbi:hypothetical protein CDD82_2050 [Ophiocordyceps australis]|uniref:Uncharacterized protein n=1 Tax=Ophiocordyceps australis TaxID=1399860 RepID=A0A2C5X8Y6_9HYPO|nr:hypothetical protein CDD82_2050 [Ophiocordyceps australis]
MAEVAGLVLGALPIAFSILGICIQSCMIRSHYEAGLPVLQAELRLQDKRLKKSLRGLGIANPTDTRLPPLLRDKFPDIHQELLSIIEQMHAGIMAMLGDLEVHLAKPHWAARVRVWWEWRRIERYLKARENAELVRKFETWNDYLENRIFELSKNSHVDAERLGVVGDNASASVGTWGIRTGGHPETRHSLSDLDDYVPWWNTFAQQQPRY